MAGPSKSSKLGESSTRRGITYKRQHSEDQSAVENDNNAKRQCPEHSYPPSNNAPQVVSYRIEIVSCHWIVSVVPVVPIPSSVFLLLPIASSRYFTSSISLAHAGPGRYDPTWLEPYEAPWSADRLRNRGYWLYQVPRGTAAFVLSNSSSSESLASPESTHTQASQ
jgi:hypothetical protein